MSKIKTYKPNNTARTQAMLFTEENIPAATEWAGDKLDPPNPRTPGWRVHTLEGWLNIPFGHYLVRGTRGEFYPVAPEVMRVRWVEVKE